MKNFVALTAVLALAACASPPPPQVFAPLDYSYLRPITFKVANLSVVNNYVPSADETQLIVENPAPPAATLLAMLNQRMQPDGQPGTATITVQAAGITELGGNLNGQMTVDINLASADGRSTGFASASVSASETEPDAQADLPGALYQMTKQLMDRINVQLPYQIAHNIPSWVAWTSTPGAVPAALAPGGIQATPLTAPGATPGTPMPGAPVPLAPTMAVPVAPSTTTTTTTTTTINPAVPSYLPGAGPAALTPPQ
jgi:hypothetical protein